MAFFNIRQWIDRISQHPNRRTLTNVEDPTDVKTYDLSRAEGEVSVQGTALTAANLNDLENRIGSAFTAVENAMPKANPAEEATGSLTKLKVDGTVYEIEGGGGEPQTGTIENVEVASFSDGADDVPVSELIVDIEAVQEGSGVPSPTNVRAIHGWTECNLSKCGVNLWDEEWEVGYISVLDGRNSSSRVNIRSKNYIPIKPNVSLYLNANIVTVYCPIIFYDKDKKFLSSVAQRLWNRTITTPENAYYMRFYMHDSYGTTYNNDISINYPSSDTQYHSYIGNTYPVYFGQTVYGGHLNVSKGLLTIDRAYVDLGALTWTKVTSFTNILFLAIVTGKATNNSNIICSNYNNVGIATGGTFLNNMANNSIASDTATGIYIRDDANSSLSAADFKAAMSGVQFVYELATPIEIQLTPVQVKTLLGNNNIFADTGKIEKLVYFKTGCEAVVKLIEAYNEEDGIQTVLLEATDWDTTTNTITVDVTGVTTTSNQEILPLPATSAANIANNKALQACNLMDYGQVAGQITLYAENIPSEDLSIRVIVGA